MSGVYEIRQLSELLITINILQSEIRLSAEDAKVILGYMQGHDFMLVLDVGQLVRVDISEEQGSKVPYTMDEVIDLVCEWKYEQLEKAREAVENPKMEDRDRFVLSKGHVAPGLYSTLAERGYFPKEDLVTLRHTGSYLQGHPDMKHIPGVDMSSGSLGQGLSVAVGMAAVGKYDKKDYRVYTLCGDGEIQEGQIWEAAMWAGFKKLDNLVVVVDNNNLQIDGAVDEVCSPYPIDKKFEAFNFHVINIDGNDFDQIRAAFKEARETKGMPTAIIAKTVKGKGVSFMENVCDWHGKAPNDEQYEVAMADLEKVGEALCQK